MYDVMIIDDEAMIRKGLKNFIDWKSLDCKVTHVLKNGKEAIEILKANQPNIILTDIKMPKVSGIDLAKYVYNNNLNIPIIILTGHSDFNYSHSAIQYGVVDFVLKPTSTERLVDAINKAKKKLSEEDEKSTLIKNLEEELTVHTTQSKKYILKDILNQVYTNPVIILEKLSQYCININNFCCINIILDLEKSQKKVFKKQHIFMIKDFIDESFDSYNYYCVPINQNQIATIVSFSDEKFSENSQTVVSICNEIIHMVKTFSDFNISIGISKFHVDPITLASAYIEANEALNNHFYENIENIFIYSKAEKLLNHTFNYLENIKNILTLINENNWEEIIIKFEQFYNEIQLQKISIDQIISITIFLYNYLNKKCIYSGNCSLEEVENHINIITKINNCKSINEAYEILFNKIQSLIESYSVPVNTIVKKTNEYIYKNYNQNITLSKIAANLHVNSSYLSRLYKQETNTTVTVALTKFRMEKAKELLETTDFKIYEISHMVGINEPTYFSQIFKRYFGINPKQKRK